MNFEEELAWITQEIKVAYNNFLNFDKPHSEFNPLISAEDDYNILKYARFCCERETGCNPSGEPNWNQSDKWWIFYNKISTTNRSYVVGDYFNALVRANNCESL